MIEKVLESLGLTKSEIAIYFALLDLGPSTTGPIIKKAQIASGKAYLIMDKLVEKGLVTYTLISGTKNYQAKNPERLFDYLNEKKEELNQIELKLKQVMPELKNKFNEQKTQTKAEIFEGIQGFKTFHKFMLDECNGGDTVCVFGAPREANEKFGAYFVDWNGLCLLSSSCLRLNKQKFTKYANMTK